MENNLTRKQKRHNERVGAEAKEVYTKLTAKFLEFFIYSEGPDEQKIVDKMDELSKKWRLYCKAKNLLPTVYPIVDQYMEGVIKQYSEMEKLDPELQLKKAESGIPA